MKAVIIKETRTAAVADIQEQSMRRDYIRVKTVALALNPSTRVPIDSLPDIVDMS